MLVLSRKKNEGIHIGGDIIISVVEVLGDRVRLGVTAPPNVQIVRSEIFPNWQARKTAPAAPKVNPTAD
jgi:carbon storage regulator